MAREAKVGLLLGLVFIVAIAIVLRGVHESSNTGLEQSLDIATAEIKPLEMETLSVAVENLNPPKTIFITPPRPIIPAQQTIVAQPVRPITPPSGFAAQPIPPQPVRYTQELPRSPYQQGNTQVRPQQPQGTPVIAPAGKLPDTVTDALDKITFRPPNNRINVSTLTPKKSKASIYVVQQGDDLSRIALEVYGREEGKRWVNVERIFKANKRILPSADMVREGQRLMIPPLSTGVAPQQAQKNSPQKKRPTQQKPIKKIKKTYVVKDGDSLWKIAAAQLGNGSRYDEIMALNTKTLRDEDNLFVGMRLNLPVH